MAVIAAQTIDWANPSVYPRGEAVSFPTESMYMAPVLLSPVVPAPYVYSLVPPSTPVEAELIALNDSVVQVLSL